MRFDSGEVHESTTNAGIRGDPTQGERKEMDSAMSRLGEKDRQSLQRHGIGVDDAECQLTVLRAPRTYVELDEACTVGDGIEVLTPQMRDSLIRAHQDAVAEQRWMNFVPASGAASRMFSFRRDREKRRFCRSLVRFAFANRLRDHLTDRGMNLGELLRDCRYDDLIDAVIGQHGLGFATQPKGLIEFHCYGDASRTAFEEHVLEASACLGADDQTPKVHFTVGDAHRHAFQERLERFREETPEHLCAVGFSTQDRSTDTIAVDDQGNVLRNAEGEPVFRPGGHGGLIENLNRLEADLVFVKNIDNVCHQRMRDETLCWTRTLGGYLVRVERAIHEHLRALRADDDRAVTAACDLVSRLFPGSAIPPFGDPAKLRLALLDQLCRPLRVCGVVKNKGEPGGGPFWVRREDGGLSQQIIESAEVDLNDSKQRAIFENASHFNPVFMALAVRNELGENYDLRQFVDDKRYIVTKKTVGDRNATVLERPGLWNGGMANWNTVFVEIPEAVFSPVKSVFDLLRPPHQARQSKYRVSAAPRSQFPRAVSL
jgi:hypothetical protein